MWHCLLIIVSKYKYSDAENEIIYLIAKKNYEIKSYLTRKACIIFKYFVAT